MNATMAEYSETANSAKSSGLTKRAPNMIAEDAVEGFLVQLPILAVPDAKLKDYQTNWAIAAVPAMVISEMPRGE